MGKKYPVKIYGRLSLFSFSELWKNRELLYFFVWKNIKVMFVTCFKISTGMLYFVQ